MKIRIIILFLVSIFIFVAQADCDELDQARALFYKGNAYYSDEKFEQAIAQYEEALRLGFESGSLYYNLGNTYFKNGSLGKAILNYLRAKRLIPKDADLKSNLDYARPLINGGVVAPERKWFARMFFTVVDAFSLDKITTLCIVLYFILLTLLVLMIVAKRLRRIFVYMGSLVLVVLVVCILIFSVQFNNAVVQKQAVIVVKSADSKFEPFSDATTFFILEEGESVVLIASRNEWVKVRRIDGKQGWIKESDIELL
ncbi:tetratricopeptide repeat protein [bacterium]|nr:tetratricopeptide repeat protein [bacterium]